MTISRSEGRETGRNADVGGRLVDSKTEAGNFDGGIVERKEVCESELGGRHGGLGGRIVVCFSVCSTFIGCLELGGQRSVVRMDVPRMLRQCLNRERLILDGAYFCGE